MRPDIDAEALLALWECAAGQPPWARGDALLGAAWPDVQAPLTLGDRNSKLLHLHERVFGASMALLSHCPACDAVAEFSADCAELAARMPAADAASRHTLQDDNYLVEFRLPSNADVVAASSGERPEDFPCDLLGRCVLTCTAQGADVPVRELPPPVLDELSRRMETLDPGAIVSFGLQCPSCGAHWSAPFDVGQFVWQQVQAAAERLLLDVDALARSYGWSEGEVLRLNPLRRSAYLQLVTG